METTVEGFCNAMSRCQFLTPEQIRTVRQQWLQEAGNSATQVDRFLAWLVAKEIATEYQVGVITRGNGSQLFLGPYRLMERTSKGRMAGVYKAKHTSGAIVAVKILPPSKAAQPLQLARFQRELKLAVSVRHPNIIRSFHGGAFKSLHYLVMEHLEGETLEELLARRKRLPVGEAVALVHQALLGLQAIHEQGLVHRDLKPANLMLVGGKPDKSSWSSVKILDLGMGRALFDEEEGGGPRFDLTQPGEMLGSSDYMSPEQARDSHNIDIRTDIYALGCVLYQALAGETPFADVSPVRQLLRHATEEARPITEHNRDVPGGLQQVLSWMLAKDPAQRYPAPARAAQALEMFVAANNAATAAPAPAAKVYLEWVDSLNVAEYEVVQDADDSLPPPAMPKRKTVAPALKAPSNAETLEYHPRAHSEAKTLPPVSFPQPAPPPPPPLFREQKPTPPRPPKQQEQLPIARTVLESRPPGLEEHLQMPPRVPRGLEHKQDEEEEDEPARVMGMTPKELLILCVGLLSVLGLTVVGILIWLISRAFK